MKGHVPPPPGIDAEVDLGVGGPMARNMGDLKLLWDVLNERPPVETRPAKSGRIALWNEEAGWPLAHAVKERIGAAGAAFERAGLRVERAKPKIDMGKMVETYLDLLTPIIAAGFPDALLEKMAQTREADLAAVREGRDGAGEARYRLRVTASPADILAAQRARQAHKGALAEFFEDYDAILMPITPIPAFPHDQSDPMNARTITVDGDTAPYMSMLNWIALATSLHAPALAMPAGRTPEGLPVGVQLVGPLNGEDRLFALAAAAEEILCGFSPPDLALP